MCEWGCHSIPPRLQCPSSICAIQSINKRGRYERANFREYLDDYSHDMNDVFAFVNVRGRSSPGTRQFTSYSLHRHKQSRQSFIVETVK